MEHVGCPGVGESLGQCAVCGDSFLTEIVFHESVKTFSLTVSDQMLYAHKKCLSLIKKLSKQNKTLLDLPEKSPLRKAAEKQLRNQNER